MDLKRPLIATKRIGRWGGLGAWLGLLLGIGEHGAQHLIGNDALDLLLLALTASAQIRVHVGCIMLIVGCIMLRTAIAVNLTEEAREGRRNTPRGRLAAERRRLCLALLLLPVIMIPGNTIIK